MHIHSPVRIVGGLQLSLLRSTSRISKWILLSTPEKLSEVSVKPQGGAGGMRGDRHTATQRLPSAPKLHLFLNLHLRICFYLFERERRGQREKEIY